jgi:hypothetical protein
MAAYIVGDTGDIARFPTAGFAGDSNVAPIHSLRGAVSTSYT